MPTRFMMTLVTIAVLLASGQALAQISDFQAGQVLTADELNSLVEQVNTNTEQVNTNTEQVNTNTDTLSEDGPASYAVDCASGTIAEAMSKAQPGDTIMITGTCGETVEVNKDGITLDGNESAVIDGMDTDGSVISVVGHQNVAIKGLTIQGGNVGIRVANNAYAYLEEVVVKNNEDGVVVLTNSAVFVNDCTIEENQQDGIRVKDNSTVRLDEITSRNNGGDGIAAYNNSLIVADMDADTISIMGNSRGIYAVNGVGVHLWNAFITGNMNDDVVAEFGSRVTFTGGAIGTQTCDDSALIEGLQCPVP